MNGKPVRMRYFRERNDLVRPVDSAGFRRLRDRKHRGRDVMRPAPFARESARQGVRRDLAGIPR